MTGCVNVNPSGVCLFALGGAASWGGEESDRAATVALGLVGNSVPLRMDHPSMQEQASPKTQQENGDIPSQQHAQDYRG